MYITHDCLMSYEDERYRYCGIYPCKSAWSDLIQTNYCVGEPVYVGETTKRGREVEAKHRFAEVGQLAGRWTLRNDLRLLLYRVASNQGERANAAQYMCKLRWIALDFKVTVIKANDKIKKHISYGNWGLWYICMFMIVFQQLTIRDTDSKRRRKKRLLVSGPKKPPV